MNKFWKSWKNKTTTEKELIQELEKTELTLKKEIKNIKSTYIKGTFPRRETIRGSDVDLVIIFKENNYENKKQKIKQELKKQELNKISISAFSINELKKGKTQQGKNATRFSKHIDEYILLLGTELKKEELKTRSEEQDFKNMISAFHDIFLPKYESKEMTFHEITKQVFWLTDNELRYKKIKPKTKWSELVKQTQKINNEHIIKQAHDYREQKEQNKTTTEKEQKEFIKKLKQHLKELKKELTFNK